jgi:hypothetical protein
MAADWLNQLGLPVGAAKLAAAIYGASVAAEKAASRRALRDISNVLLDTKIEESTYAQAAALTVFQATFGKRHFSLRCFAASVVETLFTAPFVFFLTSTHQGVRFIVSFLLFFPVKGIIFLLTIVVSDYAALLKTRALLSFRLNNSTNRHLLGLVAFSVVDIVSSAAIAFSFYFLFQRAILMQTVFDVGIRALFDLTRVLTLYAISPGVNITVDTFRVVLGTSVITSIWSLLAGLSAFLLATVKPIHRFMVWFFDVETHPLQAIGVVSGALVIAWSLIWTGIKAVIGLS